MAASDVLEGKYERGHGYDIPPFTIHSVWFHLVPPWMFMRQDGPLEVTYHCKRVLYTGRNRTVLCIVVSNKVIFNSEVKKRLIEALHSSHISISTPYKFAPKRSNNIKVHPLYKYPPPPSVIIPWKPGPCPPRPLQR